MKKLLRYSEEDIKELLIEALALPAQKVRGVRFVIDMGESQGPCLTAPHLDYVEVEVES